ncbi:inositol monophosphatase family protein [Burkholderia gladioli]|uniref:inositol monophosphatase family protein n=1 Tax=Burkholderia gladioli TaxID=28095 RepID=UPI003132D56A
MVGGRGRYRCRAAHSGRPGSTGSGHSVVWSARSRSVRVRPMAATSLQLAYVAAGRLDAYLETGDDAADWLAGALLIREAGGTVTDLRNERFGWSGDGVLGTNAKLHRALVAMIARATAAEGDAATSAA